MPRSGNRAVLFAYHNVGSRGLAALLSCGVDVRLLVTHLDNPQENIWFSSVEELAILNGIPVIKPDAPNTPDVIARVAACEPDWLFSFYYRHMLGEQLLQIPRRGALNLHGSLLPKYRGRVPINWAIVHGETKTGASLHYMVAKPDAGNLVDQEAVPILPNDTAHQVFQKVTCAAETVLIRAVPKLLTGAAQDSPLKLEHGSYFGGRKPEDGRIMWQRSAQEIHNLIRAVAPPYPGAFFEQDGRRISILGSYFRNEAAQGPGPRIYWLDSVCWADCADGKKLRITRLDVDGKTIDEITFRTWFGTQLTIS